MNSSYSGIIVDPVSAREFAGTIHVQDGRIVSVVEEEVNDRRLIMPGFVDAHIHIESSMLPPTEFARIAVVHGTVATVSDPHEIANVLGMEGMRFMLDNAAQSPLKICFGAPSCVPATRFETAGASISVDDIEQLFGDPRIGYLSEMMNYPGVLFGDDEVLTKLELAKRFGRPIDGHAPGLRADDARRYASHGISTDHECFTLDEALDKIAVGMKIIIREGSAARNFEALHDLLRTHPDAVMLCSDDRHPDSLVLGHINTIVLAALQKGHDRFAVVRAAGLNAVQHYRLNVGMLQQGDPADFIVVESWESMRVLQTFINGQLVAEHGASLLPHIQSATPNAFVSRHVESHELRCAAKSSHIRVVEVHDGQLVTTEAILEATVQDGYWESDTQRDILKMVVCNRYENAAPGIAFIKNIGLTRGAMASSVAHDSHNIVAVGCTDKDIAHAINALMDSKGGVCVVDGDTVLHLPLPIAGLMSDMDGYALADAYARIDAHARSMGSSLRSPFMSLSFMALLVIPELKLSDRGLFDGRRFEFCSLGVES